MASCCYWGRYLLWPNCWHHHFFGNGSLLLCDDSIGLGMSCCCLTFATSLVVDHLHPFWRQTCGGARPKVGQRVPAPLKLFFRSSSFAMITVSLRWRRWSEEEVFASYSYQSHFDTSCYGGLWPCYDYGADPMAYTGRLWLQSWSDGGGNEFSRSEFFASAVLLLSLLWRWIIFIAPLFNYVLTPLPMAGYGHATATALIQWRV